MGIEPSLAGVMVSYLGMMPSAPPHAIRARRRTRSRVAGARWLHSGAEAVTGMKDQLIPSSADLAEDERIVVIDDDPAVRFGLDSLFRSVGLTSDSYGSVQDFMTERAKTASGCLVLDVRLPGISGLDLQDQLGPAGIELPVVFMTGHGDISMTVRAMKAGAVDFLAKPFREQDMLEAVSAALSRSRRRRREASVLAERRRRFDSLSPRERDVMHHVVAGLMNKQVAHVLGISEITVKIHRGNLMRKLDVQTLPDLVRAGDGLSIERDDAMPVHISV